MFFLPFAMSCLSCRYQIVRFPATETVAAKDAKEACGEVLKGASVQLALPEDSWQLGKSKVRLYFMSSNE